MLTHDVPTIMCYDHADTFMNKTAPIRGTNGIRPLGQRRYWKDRWVAFCDAPYHKHSIEVGSYKNPFVRFHTNGNVEFLHGKWDINARQIVGAMFRPRFTPRYGNADKWYLYDKVKHVQYRITRDKPLVLRCIKTEQGLDYIFEGELVAEQKPYIIRDKYEPIIKQYRDFLKYVEVMNKLSGGVYQDKDFPEYAQSKSTLDMALELVANKTIESAPEEFANAFNCLVRECAVHQWYPPNHGYVCTTNNMKKYVYRWVKENHADTIYEMREVPNTTIVR